MKNRAMVSERGTVTIPGPIRQAAHIYPGDMLEFEPRGHNIILRHLIVRPPEGEAFMTTGEWDKFDELVKRQVRKGEYVTYKDLEKAKRHSRKLMRKK